jgi:hypothetical protein
MGKGAVKETGAIVAEQALAAYCPDLADWPASWRIEERDVASGQQILECFKPFLVHLLSLRLSKKALHKHRDNLWLLGGEIIGEISNTPKLTKRPIEQLLFSVLDEEGGPLLSHHESEQAQRAFDSTCRKFFRFLSSSKDQVA